mgnify:CR=1 FL=1
MLTQEVEKIEEINCQRDLVSVYMLFLIKGTRYEIVGKGDVINTIEPKNQGLQTIIYISTE